MSENKIDPWGSINIEDYEHIFKEFGLKKFTDYSLIDNYLFNRKIIIAHRDFEKILDCIQNNQTFLQLTGIASSGPFHLGHKLDIDFFLLFRQLGAKSKFVISDIDAYLSRPDYKVPNMDKAKENALDNILDLLALGVKEDEIYLQSNQKPEYYQLSYEFSKKITENMFKAIYGHTDFGKFGSVILQVADILHLQLPSVFGKAPTLTGIGLEQDPHARITRDLAKRCNYDFEIPSFFYFQHQSGLKEGKKMSASEPDTAIFLSDDEKEIKRKINKTFTGGRISLEEQKEKGGQPEICKVYEIFKYHNPNNDFLENTYKKCISGELLCGQCKKNCIEFLTKKLNEHKNKKEQLKHVALRILKK